MGNSRSIREGTFRGFEGGNKPGLRSPDPASTVSRGSQTGDGAGQTSLNDLMKSYRGWWNLPKSHKKENSR
jgi:hypothetical protein